MLLFPYGVAEGALSAYALFFPTFFKWVAALSQPIHIESVAGSFAFDVFRHVAVWYGWRKHLLILGYSDEYTPPTLEQLQERVARKGIAAGLRRASELFATDYQHARPFSAEAPCKAWRRCDTHYSGIEDCDAARASIERMLQNGDPLEW